MTALLSRLLLLTARHTGRHRKQVTEGETQRATALFASWKEIGIWGISR